MAKQNGLEQEEDVASVIASLGKVELMRRIATFRGRFKLDFTEEHLSTLSEDRLRHILLAALLTHRKEGSACEAISSK